MKNVFQLFVLQSYPTTGERRIWIVNKENFKDAFSYLALTMALNRAEMTSHGYTREEVLTSPKGEDIARKTLYYGTTLGIIEPMFLIK